MRREYRPSLICSRSGEIYVGPQTIKNILSLTSKPLVLNNNSIKYINAICEMLIKNQRHPSPIVPEQLVRSELKLSLDNLSDSITRWEMRDSFESHVREREHQLHVFEDWEVMLLSVDNSRTGSWINNNEHVIATQEHHFGAWLTIRIIRCEAFGRLI